MSAAAQTKIFGVRIKLDPKILVGGLIVVAALLFWYNSRSDDEQTAPAAAAHRQTADTALPAFRPRVSARRREAATNDRGTLRLRAIDPTRGDVDPTLRLDLLARLQSVQPAGITRSLFELGPAPQTAAASLPIHAPIITPGRLPGPGGGTQSMGTPAAAALEIPLKYYGFAKPVSRGESNRGFFMDGDNVLVGAEGEVLNHRYLVVELTPNSARLEDVQLKQGQTLQVVPEAVVQ